MTDLPNLRPDVVDVIRTVMAGQAAGDTRPVIDKIRRRLRGESRQERLRFEATLAWAAGELAMLVPDDAREAYFAAMLRTDGDLRWRAFEITTGLR